MRAGVNTCALNEAGRQSAALPTLRMDSHGDAENAKRGWRTLAGPRGSVCLRKCLRDSLHPPSSVEPVAASSRVGYPQGMDDTDAKRNALIQNKPQHSTTPR